MRSPTQLRVVAKTVLQALKRLLHSHSKITKLKCKCVELCFEFVVMSEDGNVENNFLASLVLVECSHPREDDVMENSLLSGDER